MSDIGAGDVVRDHEHAVGAIGARCPLDVLAADEGYGSEAVGGEDCGRGGGSDTFIDRSQLQLDVNDGHRSRIDDDVLRSLREALAGDADGIIAEHDGVELEFPVGIGSGAFSPVRPFGFECHRSVSNGAMLGVVHNTANGAVDVGEGGGGDENKGDN